MKSVNLAYFDKFVNKTEVAAVLISCDIKARSVYILSFFKTLLNLDMFICAIKL